MGSSAKGSKNPTTKTSTPKSVEHVAVEVMQTWKVAELFQIMAIISLNMGNLNLEVSSLKNKLAPREKEKGVLHDELDKKIDFHKGYKHNVEIWRKNIVEVEQKIKMFIKNLQYENEEPKGSTTWLKSQDEKLQDLSQKAKI
jgi:hypothetical protein